MKTVNVPLTRAELNTLSHGLLLQMQAINRAAGLDSADKYKRVVEILRLSDTLTEALEQSWS